MLMPLIDRPILSTIERNDSGGMIARMAASILSTSTPGFLDPRSRRGAHVQSDLRALDWRKEVAAEVRRKRERGENRSHEAAR